jgi:hypothetical protein
MTQATAGRVQHQKSLQKQGGMQHQEDATAEKPARSQQQDKKQKDYSIIADHPLLLM